MTRERKYELKEALHHSISQLAEEVSDKIVDLLGGCDINLDDEAEVDQAFKLANQMLKQVL